MSVFDNMVRRVWTVLWQFDETTISHCCCLNGLKMKVCLFNLLLCADVVALEVEVHCLVVFA